MPFAKLAFCESTQVAIDLFHMFRNENVNHVRSEDGMFTSLYIPPEISDTDQKHVFSDAVSGGIADMISGRYNKVLVHDVVTQDGENPSEIRQLEFHVRNQVSDSEFLIYVGRSYLDNGENVCGMSAWTFRRASLTNSSQKFLLKIELEVCRYVDDGVWFTDQHRANIQGYVTVRSSTSMTK